MAEFTKNAVDVFAGYDAAGNPRQPIPHDAQVWGTDVERAIFAYKASGGVVFATKAEMDGELDYDYPQEAWCLDPTESGIYQKQGPSGSGSWKKVGDLPYSFIRAENTNSGDPNAITATTTMPIPATDGGALISLNIVADNTSDAPTVSFNGSAALTITDALGTPVSAGGLTAGMLINGYIVGTTFRADMGPRGWSPLLRIVQDGERRVVELYDWTGGHGAKPTETGYIGPNGLTQNIADATDIRGPEGPNGPGTGDMLKDTYDPDRVEVNIYDLSKGFGADPSNDAAINDTAFLNLKGFLGDKEIDLQGRTYPVSSIPDINAKNGYWKVGDIEHLAPDTISFRSYKITNNDLYSCWPQDKAHHDDEGVRYVLYQEGTDHGAEDKRLMMKRSYDGGISWDTAEMLWGGTLGARESFGAGQRFGQQFIVRRDLLGPYVQRWFRRRLGEEKQIASPFATTSGSDVVEVSYKDQDGSPKPHGLKTGDIVRIVNVGGAINGVTISGDFSVTRTGHTTFTVQGTGNASASGSNLGPSDVLIRFKEGEFTEYSNFDGNNFGDALATHPPFSEVPTLVQSMAFTGDDDAWLGVSGGGGDALVRVSGIFSGSDIADVIALDDSLSETTLCTDGTYIYGMRRANISGQAPGFFWTTADATASTNLVATQFGFVFGEDNPLPIRYDEATDTLYAVTADRNREYPYTPQELSLYLLVADASAARANGADAFRVIEISKIYGGGWVGTTAASETGVPSLDLSDGVLSIYYASGESLASPVIGSSWFDTTPNSPNIWGIDIPIGNGLGKEGDTARVGRGSTAHVGGETQRNNTWAAHVNGLPAIADEGYLEFTGLYFSDLPYSIDTSGSGGFITFPWRGVYQLDLQVRYAAGTIETNRWVELVDESDASLILRQFCFSRSDDLSSGFSSFLFAVNEPGLRGRFKVNATDGVAETTSGSYLCVRKVR